MILRSEARVNAELVAAAQEMCAAIKAADVAKVQKLTTRYDELSFQMQQLEEKRLETADALARELGIRAGHVRMAELVKALPAECRPALLEVRAELQRRIAELTRVTASIQVLLEESLATVARIVTLASRAASKTTGYGQGGVKVEDGRRRVIVNKTV
jgi:uncharacterized coiled-coil DUF342 family protein